MSLYPLKYSIIILLHQNPPIDGYRNSYSTNQPTTENTKTKESFYLFILNTNPFLQAFDTANYMQLHTIENP
jgi:hypothetical protein